MRVTISLDFDALKDDIRDAFGNRLDDLDYSNEEIEKLLASFDENIVGGYMDATFEVAFTRDGEGVTECMLVGG